MTNVKTTEETTRMIPSFMAVSNELPIIGRRYQCKKIKADPETGVYWQKMHTSPVVSVTELAKNVMAVKDIQLMVYYKNSWSADGKRAFCNSKMRTKSWKASKVF